jgi:hypothetical protein
LSYSVDAFRDNSSALFFFSSIYNLSSWFFFECSKLLAFDSNERFCSSNFTSRELLTPTPSFCYAAFIEPVILYLSIEFRNFASYIFSTTLSYSSFYIFLFHSFTSSPLFASSLRMFYSSAPFSLSGLIGMIFYRDREFNSFILALLFSITDSNSRVRLISGFGPFTYDSFMFSLSRSDHRFSLTYLLLNSRFFVSLELSSSNTLMVFSSCSNSSAMVSIWLIILT